MEVDGTVLRCTNCQEELEQDWESCPVCQTPTSGVKVQLECPNCKYKIKKHWKECPKCHTKLSGWATPLKSSSGINDPGESSEQFFLSGPIDNNTFGMKITIPDNEVIAEKYTIKKKLGQGGYGSVYLAHDSVLDEEIALKIVIVGKGKTERAVEQLIHEFKLREKVHDSSHIIKAYDPRSCEYKGLSLVLLPMEFAKGGNFRTWLNKKSNKKERLQKAIELFYQTCLGVKAIHDAGLSHLDIKPENILLINNVAKITDFGIGRYIDNQQDLNPIQLMHQGIGTPQYMSPEQFKVARQKEVGHASDIYTLGLLLYEILDGNLPFDGSPEELKEKHLTLPPPILKGYNELWWKIINKCLSKKSADRYQNISFLINDIDRMIRGLPLSTDVSCPKCNHVNENINVKFCEKCGNDLKNFFHPCLVCAKEVRIDVEHCPGCNAPIREQYLYLSRKKQIEILKDEDPIEAIELLEIVLRSDGGGTENEINLIKELRSKSEKISPIITEANKFHSDAKIEKAIDSWCRVLNFFPRHRIALQQLEILEKQLKDFLELKTKAIDCMDEGNFEEAESSLQTCFELIPGRKEIKELLNELNQRSHKYYLSLNQAKSSIKSKRLFEAKNLITEAKNYATKSKEIPCMEQDISQKFSTAENLLSTAKTNLTEAKFREIDKLIVKIKNIITDHPEVENFLNEYKNIELRYKEKIQQIQSLQKSGDLEQAVNVLNSAKALCPNSKEIDKSIKIITELQSEVYLLLKNIKKYFKSAEFDLAEEALAKAENLWSKFSDLADAKKEYLQTKDNYRQQVQEARDAQNSGEFAKALQKLESAKELCPNSAEVHNLINIISKQQEEALDCVEEAKKYSKSAEFDLCEDYLKKAEKLWPSFFELETFKDEYKRLKESYNKEIQDAKIAQVHNNFKGAFKHLRAAEKLCPDSDEVHSLILQIRNNEKLMLRHFRIRKIKRGIIVLGLLAFLSFGSFWYMGVQEKKHQEAIYKREQLERQKAEEKRKKQEVDRLRKQQEEKKLALKRERELLIRKKAKIEKEIETDIKNCNKYFVIDGGSKNYVYGVYKERIPIWQDAVKLGLSGGEYLIGICYERGFEFKKNRELAVYWYKKASDKGLSLAQYSLGYCYEQGIGLLQNNSEAVKWYKKAAKQGLPQAQNKLADSYYHGRGVVKNYTEALRWYEKAADSEPGLSQAQYNLATFYRKGDGGPQNYTKALKWYRKAAEQGRADAQTDLAYYCYEQGIGAFKNYTEAVKWYKKAAERGYAAAQFHLGNCYHEGKGVSQDYTEAAKWYGKAAKRGHAESQYMLGNCYRKGEGVNKWYSEAFKWYKASAYNDCSDAQNDLAYYFYEYGRYIYHDYVKAVEYYTKAAEQGHAIAQYNLGNCYCNGKGVSPNYTEAAKWYKKAADQGDADAQNNLGILYENGQGVPQSYTKAKMWYKKAAEQGHSIAKENLRTLMQKN